MRVALSSRSLAGGNLAAAIDQAADLQAGGIEIWVEDIWRQDESPERLADVARAHGIALSAYAAGGDRNIISPDAEDRERAMRWAVESVAVARRLGADVLTIEPGRLAGGLQTLASGWRPLLSAARTLSKVAEDQRQRVALENPAPAPDRVLTHLVDAQSLLREVVSPYLGITLNLTHLAASDEDASYWIDGTDRTFQLRVTPERPRRTLLPVLGGAKQRALFVERLKAAGFHGGVVLDDPTLLADPGRVPDSLAQIRRWFIVRSPVAAARQPVARARRSGNSA